MKHCAHCRQAFTATVSWHRLCWTCWRQDRDRQHRDAQDDTFERGWQAGYQAGLRNGTKTLDEPLLLDLIQLAHPDRHPPERGELANRATAQLIELRQTITRRAAA